jgi:hypothetical protein
VRNEIQGRKKKEEKETAQGSELKGSLKERSFDYER